MKTKIILIGFFAILLNSFCFSQNAEKVSNVKLLQKYSTENKPFKLQANIEGMSISKTGQVIIPSLKDSLYEIRTSSIEADFLEDRFDFMDPGNAVIVLKLVSSSPKVYELLYVYALMTVAEYKDLSSAEGAVVLKELNSQIENSNDKPKVTKDTKPAINYDARFKNAQDLENKKRYYEAIEAYSTIAADSNDPHCFEASKRIIAIEKQFAGSIPGLGNDEDYMKTFDDLMQLTDDVDKLNKKYGY